MAATGYISDPRAVTSVEGRTGAVDVSKTDVGLGNVDNTSDANKPISSATQTALDGKSSTSHDHAGVYATVSHSHAAGDTTSGTFAIGRIPTGTSSTTVATGDHTHTGTYANASHTHSGADITSGTVPFAQLPTGTSSSTVAVGNHTHGVATGGTGLTSITSGSYVKGAGTSALVERTPAQVRTDLGFDPAWTAPDSYAANMSNVGSPWYDVGAWVNPSGQHTWRGRVLAGANYTANATIFTLNSAVRPTRDVEFQCRSIGVGAVAGFMKVTASTGAVSFSSAITVGAGSGWTLDGISFFGGAN